MATVEEAEHRRYERSLDRARVLTLSDGVFAIALTLLVLDLRVPDDGRTSAADVLRQSRSPLIAFLISFAVIASAWANHRDLFEVIKLTDRNLVWLNLLYLLPLTMIPFGAGLLSRYELDPAALTIYGGLLLAIALLRLWIWLYATNRPRLLFEPVDDELRKAGVYLVLVPICLDVVAIGVAQLGTVGQAISLAIYGLIPVLYFLTIIFTPPELRLLEKHKPSRDDARSGDEPDTD